MKQEDAHGHLLPHCSLLSTALSMAEVRDQERLYASEVIAGGKTVRLDDSLPAVFRASDTPLLIRSHEEVATLIAPSDFPVEAVSLSCSKHRYLRKEFVYA